MYYQIKLFHGVTEECTFRTIPYQFTLKVAIHVQAHACMFMCSCE